MIDPASREPPRKTTARKRTTVILGLDPRTHSATPTGQATITTPELDAALKALADARASVTIEMKKRGKGRNPPRASGGSREEEAPLGGGVAADE
jgi:hypothetical protein